LFKPLAGKYRREVSRQKLFSGKRHDQNTIRSRRYRSRTRAGATGFRAAKAAAKSGDGARARDYYEKIVAMTDGADQRRTELADARAYLNKR
jgi:hypothetical protein